MTKTEEKEKAMLELQRAVRLCQKLGYTIVVGSDPEGNSWHSLPPQKEAIFVGGTNDKYIALQVWGDIEEDEAFKPVYFCKSCFKDYETEAEAEKCKESCIPKRAIINEL